MSERRTVTGTLAGNPGEIVFVDGTVTIGERSIALRKPASSIVLTASDGERFELSGFEHAKKLGRVELSGRWGELRGRHDFLAFVDASKIRKETTQLEVSAFVLRGGDSIQVELTETGTRDGVTVARVRRAAMPEHAIDPALPSAARRHSAARSPSDVTGPIQVRNPEPAARPHRVVGLALGPREALLFAQLELVAGESKTRENVGDGSIELQRDDRTRVRVEQLATATILSKVSRTGTYGELASDPLAKVFAGSAPGDHVEVTITGVAIFAGDRVAVDGVIAAEALVDQGEGQGFRSAAGTVVSAVHARRVAIGEEAARVLDHAPADANKSPREAPRAPAPTVRAVRYPLHTSTMFYAIAGSALFIGSLLAGWVASVSPWRVWLTPASCMGLAMLFVALNRRMRSVHHGSYVARAGGGNRLTNKSAVWGYRADGIALFGYGFVLPYTALAVSPAVTSTFYAALALLPLVHALLLAMQEAPFRRFASLVLDAPTQDPRSAKTVLVEGTVKTEGTVLRRAVSFFWDTSTRYTTDEHGMQKEHNVTTLEDRERTTVTSGAFEIDAAGSAITVDPARAHTAFSQREWAADESVSPYAESLSKGQPVCVVARFTEDNGALTARAGGEESMFVWAGTRSQLRWAQTAARARVALLIALAVVPVALGTRLFPFAMRYHADATVTSSTSATLPAGTRCSMAVLAYNNRLHNRCKVSLTCNGARLYGGWAMGEMDCEIPDQSGDITVSGHDDSRTDGDPAVRFDLRAQSASWADHRSENTVSLSLGHASPELFFE